MAKVKTRDGAEYTCDYGTGDSMMEKINDAKANGKDFIKCGGKWIRIDTIVVVSDLRAPDEEEADVRIGTVNINIGSTSRSTLDE